MKRLPAPAVLSAVVGLCGFAASAQAQCSYDIALVPDFDQRRQGALPGDGNMYCVPTSVTNWFAYFSNSGIPQPAILNGPRNWQSHANYNLASQAIGLMGWAMQTSPTGGTTGGNGLAGAKEWANTFAPGKVVVLRWACGSFCPSPAGMATVRLLGGHIAPCYGHYWDTATFPGFYTRDGGHCITAVGQTGCQSGAVLKFRDPASDVVNTSQSVFLTHSAVMTPETAWFRPNDTSSFKQGTRWRLNYGEDKFLDGWYVLIPTVALTASPTYSVLQMMQPLPLMGSSVPQTQNFPPPPNAGAITGIAMHSQLVEFYFTTAAVGSTPGKLFRVDPLSQTPAPLLAGNFNIVESNRHGELYVCEGSMLKMYDVHTSPPQLLATYQLPAAPDACAVDDQTDTLALVVPTAVPTRKQLVLLPRDISEPLAGGGLLPGPAASLDGRVSMVFDTVSPDKLYVLSANSGGHVIIVERTGMRYDGPIPMPSGWVPIAGDVDDRGHLYIVSGDVVHELMPTSTGGWAPNPESIFEGRPAHRFFKIARSRSNHDPDLHEGPTYRNLANPDILPGVPDCYANCDLSTTLPVLNVADFGCFLQKFAAGDPYANCDFSATPPILNVADFSCFLAKFAAGCP